MIQLQYQTLLYLVYHSLIPCKISTNVLEDISYHLSLLQVCSIWIIMASQICLLILSIFNLHTTKTCNNFSDPINQLNVTCHTQYCDILIYGNFILKMPVRTPIASNMDACAKLLMFTIFLIL